MLGVVLLLASLDLIATVLLKEAYLRRDPTLSVVGMLVFLLLGAVVFLAVQVTELTLVSLGWAVMAQVLFVGVDVLVYRTVPGRVQALALFVAVVALGVAIIAPSHQLPPKPEGRHAQLPAHPPRPRVSLERDTRTVTGPAARIPQARQPVD